MRFHILGPIEAYVDGNQVNIGGEKPQTLLLGLIFAKGRTVRTEQLIQIIWGDDPPSRPEVTLRGYISSLRKALEPTAKSGQTPRRLITQDGGYALQIEATAVDALRFQDIATALRTGVQDHDPSEIKRRASEALALWRTDDLSGGPISAFPGQSASLIDLRDELQELRLRSLISTGRNTQAITEVRPLIEAGPYRESLREILMLALHASGRTADALSEFQDARRRLIEDLGLDLGPSIQAVEAQILSGEAITPTPAVPSAATNAVTQAPAAPPVGRDTETTALIELLHEGTHGTQLGVLTGEPGIGKTTVANFVSHHALDLGHSVAWGRCHQGGEPDTYRPWTAILRQLLRPLSDDQKRAALGDRAVDIEPLLSAADQQPLDLSADAMRGSGAIHDAVTQTLIRLGSNNPITLVFEDLHWADVESVRLISFAMPALAGNNVTVLATWRTTERASPELQGALADVSRSAGPTRFALSGLSSAAIGELYQQTRGQASTGNIADELRDRTDGNPLFVTELLRASSTDAPITDIPTVGEAIDRRIRDLPPGSLPLLRVAALCPMGFSETLLAAVAGIPIEECLDRIENAVDARVLSESHSAHDQFTFTHALIAERLAATVSARRRTITHAKIGDVLDSEDASPSRLAYHYLRGATAARGLKAAHFARLAALDCSRRFDHSAATGLLERGLEAIKAQPQAVRSSTEAQTNRADLLIDLAQALKQVEQYERVHVVAQEGFSVAQSLGDVRRMTMAAVTHTGQTRQADGTFSQQWLGYWSPPKPAREMLRQCLDLLEPMDPLRVPALSSYAANSHDIPHDAEFHAIVNESIELARKLESDHLIVEALIHKIQVMQRTLSTAERQALADEAIVVSERSGLTIQSMIARSADLLNSMDGGHLSEALNQLETIEALGRTNHGPLSEMWGESLAISVLTFRGRFDESSDRLQRALETYAKYGTAAIDIFGLQLSTLYRETGRSDEVIEMMKWKLAGYPGVAFAVPLADAYAQAGRDDQARAVIEEYGGDAMFYGGESILQFMTPTLFSEVVDRLGDIPAANELYKSLALAENRIVAMAHGAILLGSGSLPLGRMATILGDFDAAQRHLDDAQAHHRALDAQPYIMRTSAALAVLAAAQDKPDLSRRHADEARELGERLGMTWLTNRLPERMAKAIEMHA